MDAQGTFPLLLLPLSPFVAALWNLALGRYFVERWGEKGREVVHLAAIAAVGVSFLLSWYVAVDVLAGTRVVRLVHEVYPWFRSGDAAIGFDLVLDRLSAVMVLLVSLVSTLVHVFSIGYMARDGAYHRYFAYLGLFTAAMLLLVLGKNLVVLFVGWEGVGLCSYLLIGFWFTDERKADAGRKAFIVNRIGDFGVILGMLLLFSVTASLDFDVILEFAASEGDSPFVTERVLGVSVATAATLLLFLGCTGKSAQIPLYTWLPDAMAGPTPVSALIHAATMVTAGVYLVVRLAGLFALAPVTMAIIAVVGGATALVAATVAVTQTDIKRVLAYSTVSQLGFMFVAVGMGAFTSAMFHLVTHAFFKACLFLGAGAVIEACHHEQDITTMGGLRAKLPITRMTFWISCLAIAGIAPLSGFFSKDEIILAAFTHQSVWSPGLNTALTAACLLTALLTAFYMFRLYYLVFGGTFRGDHHTFSRAHEVPIMSFPLIVLALLAAFGGVFGLPHVLGSVGLHVTHGLESWLARVVDVPYTGAYALGPAPSYVGEGGHVKAELELALMAVSLIVATTGVLVARAMYASGPSPVAARWSARLGPLYRGSRSAYAIDAFYDAVVVRPCRGLAFVLHRGVDALLIDGALVHGAAHLVRSLGDAVRRAHNGDVRRYLVAFVLGIVVIVASVYANPAAVVVGPTAVHPVDLGGLYPRLGGRATAQERRPPGTRSISVRPSAGSGSQP